MKNNIKLLLEAHGIDVNTIEKLSTDLNRLWVAEQTRLSYEHNEPHLSQGNNDFPQNNTYVEPWESMGK